MEPRYARIIVAPGGSLPPSHILYARVGTSLAAWQPGCAAVWVGKTSDGTNEGTTSTRTLLVIPWYMPAHPWQCLGMKWIADRWRLEVFQKRVRLGLTCEPQLSKIRPAVRDMSVGGGWEGTG